MAETKAAEEAKIADKALESLQSLCMSCVGLLALFAFLAPTITRSAEERQTLSHLVAWLNLSAFAKTLPAWHEFSERHIDWNSGECQDRKLARPNPEESGQPPSSVSRGGCPFSRLMTKDEHRLGGYRATNLQIDTFWPEPRTDEIFLYRRDAEMSDLMKPAKDTLSLADGETKAVFFDIATANEHLPYSDYELTL